MNKNLLYMLAMVVLFFCASSVVVYRHFENVDDMLEKQLALSHLQRDYYERVGWIRANPDEKAYRDEVQAFFRWYFGAVDKYVKRFNENKNFNDFLAELDKNSGKEVQKEVHGGFGKQINAAIDKKSAGIAERREAFEFEKKIFDTFRGGRYQPAFTGTDKGLRLDIVASDVTMVNGKAKIRLPIVIWGPPREVVEAEGIKRMRTDVNFSSNWKLFDAKNKLFGEVNVNALAMRNDFPEKLISVFPPQMVLGYFDMDMVPAAVDHMEITFNVTSHQPSGGSADGTYSWKLTTPADWKLRPGETWEGATEQTRSKEEIEGKPEGKPEARK
jgi:hypothetical protein